MQDHNFNVDELNYLKFSLEGMVKCGLKQGFKELSFLVSLVKKIDFLIESSAKIKEEDK